MNGEEAEPCMSIDHRDYMNPKHILADSAGLCAPHGVVDNIRLFCRTEHPRRVFCMINMTEGAEQAAKAIDGHVIGTIVCRLVPLSPDFHCARRKAGNMLASACDDCYMVGEMIRVEREEATV